MAGTRRGFVTGGTWCVDLNKMIDFWPPEDSIAEIHQIDVRGGGSGSNLAIDMKKLDPAMPVETIGIVGDDENGRFLLSHADSFGIGRRQMAVTKELPTQFTDCFGSKRTGRRTHIYYPGAAALLTPDHFDFAETSGRIFHLGLPGIHKLLDGPWQGDANGWVTVLKKAKAAGLTTNFELVMIEPQRLAGIIRPCLPHLDYLIVNDWEIGAIGEREDLQRRRHQHSGVPDGGTQCARQEQHRPGGGAFPQGRHRRGTRRNGDAAAVRPGPAIRHRQRQRRRRRVRCRHAVRLARGLGGAALPRPRPRQRRRLAARRLHHRHGRHVAEVSATSRRLGLERLARLSSGAGTRSSNARASGRWRARG